MNGLQTQIYPFSDREVFDFTLRERVMTDTEDALALLAAPCTDERFFHRAIKALALVTQCRWAAFARLSSNPGMIDIVAFCDGKLAIPAVEFPLVSSPCAALYQQGVSGAHLLYPSELQSLFPNSPLIKQLGANSYQAERVLDDKGEIIGHIFVMDPLPQVETLRTTEFFRLLAQRLGVEYTRLRLLGQLSEQSQMIRLTDELMSFVDTSYHYRVVSQGYEKLFDRPSHEITELTVAELHGDKVFSESLQPLLDKALSGEPSKTQLWLDTPSVATPIYLDVHHDPYFDASGHITGVIVSAHDISEVGLENAAIEFNANHDPLTGLLNRRALLQQMQHKLSAQQAKQIQLAIIYIDLDGFRQLNDRFGHHQGDKVLKDVANRLSQATHDSEIVARVGGDEFIVLASFEHGLRQSHYRRQLQHLVERFDKLMQITIDIDQHSFPLSADIGRYLVKKTDTELEEIINKADQDMYKYKPKPAC